VVLDIGGLHLADQPQERERPGLQVQCGLDERIAAMGAIREAVVIAASYGPPGPSPSIWLSCSSMNLRLTPGRCAW